MLDAMEIYMRILCNYFMQHVFFMQCFDSVHKKFNFKGVLQLFLFYAML